MITHRQNKRCTTMIKLNLPKGYLSHSQIEAWIKNKKEYRKRYYEGFPMYITPELEFGKTVAEQYEKLHKDADADVSHPVIRSIPRGDSPEYELRCEVAGVPVLGYIDSFNEPDMKIRELKTGKTPWSEARAKRHPQLKMYCACIDKIFGSYNPYVDLIWVPTKDVTVTDIIDGMSFPTRKIELTGEYKPFPVTIMRNDLLEYEKVVVRVATEISEDFTVWSRLHPQT